MVTRATVRDIAVGRGIGFANRPAVIGPVVVRAGEMSNLACPYVLGSLEPLTGWLQEVRPRAPRALPAQITRIIALKALTTLG